MTRVSNEKCETCCYHQSIWNPEDGGHIRVYCQKDLMGSDTCKSYSKEEE